MVYQKLSNKYLRRKFRMGCKKSKKLRRTSKKCMFRNRKSHNKKKNP